MSSKEARLHVEFSPVDLGPEGWIVPAGYPPGALASEKVLSGSLDEAAKTGSRTRLLRFEAGFRTTEPFVHEYWEEVLLLSGDLTVWAGKNDGGARRFEGYTYAIRPPGVLHGPFASEKGALLVEVHYYGAASNPSGSVSHMGR